VSVPAMHLKPCGLLWGRSAREAAHCGVGGLIAGTTTGFTAVEIIERQGSGSCRQWLSYGAIKGSREAALAERLALIEAPRPAVAGLDWAQPCIMGVINVTPDSFSDGGHTPEPGTAIAHGRSLAEAGATVLDVGGESTRPFADPLPLAEERARALPVVEALARDGHLVSIDTRKGAVMRAAVAAGARIVNDVSALSHDPDSLAAVRELDVPVVLMHSQGDPEIMQVAPRYDDVALDVFDALAARIAECEAAGIERARIIADPGIGFGKTYEHNAELLGALTLFHGLGVPLVVGASRKGFIGKLTGEKVAARRVAGSLGAAVAIVMQGVQMVRVHDVAETRQALAVWQAVMHETARYGAGGLGGILVAD
jgi:dihydropteroate synthase